MILDTQIFIISMIVYTYAATSLIIMEDS